MKKLKKLMKTARGQLTTTSELLMTEECILGETDFECWCKLWKASASDPDVDSEEWLDFSDRIQEHFRTNYDNFFDEFYFWNEFSGDRTLDLKIAKPAVLTSRLLLDLQKYLQMHGLGMWRIRIPVYFNPNDPRRVIVVYPRAIDIPPLCEVTCGGRRGCANCYFLRSQAAAQELLD